MTLSLTGVHFHLLPEWPIEEELRNPELEKELEKRMRRRGEGSSDKDKYQDDVKEGDDRRLSTRSDRSKDERHKDEGYGDMYREEGVRETRQREDKHREDGERDRKNRDVKHRGESERHKHRDDKYREDGERDRHREDKYYEDGNRDNKYKDDKYHEDGDRDGKHRDEKYVEIGERDQRSREGKRKQDDDRDHRHKEEKHREDVDRDHRHRDVRHRDDADREKRARDSKYRDLHTSRDHPIEPEAKRLRDDSIPADLYHRKTNNRDGSPIYDDRVTRYKDDKDRRRGNDKDEPSDYRSRSLKEQRSESEKRSSAKVDSGSERGRPASRYGDMEITASHSRRRSSPSGSSYPARDHHRVPKQEEAKYRDHVYEERARHNVHTSRDITSGQSDKLSSRSLEKVTLKDDSYTGDLSVDRRLRPDSRSSPQVDKSPSSTSNDRRNLSRSDVKRSLDLEEPGQRSGGSKDAKESMVKDVKGSRELVMETHTDNEFSQVDGDNLSVSSPYTRSSHFSGNSKSLLPPPSPFRTGSDSPFFGSTEDDRSKSNNRHRRMGDPNMGRAQGNWKNVPSWPSPLASGGYIPFQHVPPMFHPLMQQFPPPIFGRPPMKLNPGLPYHVPDHGRPLSWRNQVDESVPPPLHGWDANNAVFGDESHLYGRLDWDRRTQLSNRGWDPSADMWKGQNPGASMDAQLGPQKDGYSAHRPTDEIWPGQMGQHVENEQNQPDIQPLTMNGSQSSNALEGIAPEVQKVTESPQMFECTNMMDLDQEEALSDEFDCKILFLEEGVEANVTDGASLFAAINDSVFQKAMFLYKKQKEEFHSMNVEKTSCPIANCPEFVLPTDQDEGGSDDRKLAEEEAAEGTVLGVSKEKDELPTLKVDTDPLVEANVVDEPKTSEEPMNMEVDRIVVKQEEEPELTVERSSAVEEIIAPSAGGLPPCKAEEASESTNEEKNELGGGGGGGGGSLLLLSDVSTTAVAVMPTESIEFGSVNLSRIHHHSPESTH
ncbi:uncharacterized protein LOC112527996 isoform X3 [Cynara cardunculus var. scolymus]|uniref:uncharacterized protein LOC112527996 isoform X3 n=1 Tax=Cynara cardunculus var. scolymus TaxID=59895 RepID=UPI000D62A9FE|nr:uncharacterized protein LOC112527996 isoform X3 [Cynara cardunculus var. scolymus]